MGEIAVVDRIHPQSNKFVTGVDNTQVIQNLMTTL